MSDESEVDRVLAQNYSNAGQGLNTLANSLPEAGPAPWYDGIRQGHKWVTRNVLEPLQYASFYPDRVFSRAFPNFPVAEEDQSQRVGLRRRMGNLPIEGMRDIPYTPGERQSENVEDQRPRSVFSYAEGGEVPQGGEVDRVLAQYGQGFVAPQLNSGDGETLDTQGILSQYTRRNEGLPGVLRGWAGNVRAASRPDNMLAGGLDTAANWVAGEPQVGPDTLAPLGLGVMGSMLAPANSVGIFGGRLARTADREALSRAEEMAGRGMDRKTIWDQTGWFQGADGQWRFEINDQTARFRQPVTFDDLNAHRSVQEVMDHPALFEAYPDINPRLVDPQGGGSHGVFRGGDTNELGVIGMLPRHAYSSDQHYNRAAANQRSIGLHELQHAVQEREGFARGSNPDAAAAPAFESINERMRDLAREMDKYRVPGAYREFNDPRGYQLADQYDRLLDQRSMINGRDLYHRTAGEVEARNVMARRDFSPAAREVTPPWRSQDVPDADQILRQYSQGPQMSAPMTKGWPDA